MKMVSVARNVSGSYARLCVMVLETCFHNELTDTVSEAKHEFLMHLERTFPCICEIGTVRV
jgi:hypothetical protein